MTDRISPTLEALQTATINPAKYLGMEDIFGTVAPGQRADLVLLDSDPTRDIANTRQLFAVILGGRVIDQNKLSGMLAEARQRATEVPRK